MEAGAKEEKMVSTTRCVAKYVEDGKSKIFKGKLTVGQLGFMTRTGKSA
jgi:hypothetical protein